LSFLERCALRRLAVGQMTSTGLHSHNVAAADELCGRAVEAGAAFLALPECFAFIGSAATETVAQATGLDGGNLADFTRLAKRHKLWLSLGGFHELAPSSAVRAPAVENHTTLGPQGAPDKVWNSHVIVDDEGSIVEVYRKVHLFDVEIPGGAVLMESRSTEPGPPRAVVVDTPVGRIGLSTCYDLRFPEIYVALARQKPDVLLVPSAFTIPTGEAHWHLLLRARAVESQCYVAAAAQVGVHNEKRASYGHALAVDAWGTVLADAGSESPSIICFDIIPKSIQDLRTRMPIQKHRRQDVLDLLSAPEMP